MIKRFFLRDDSKGVSQSVAYKIVKKPYITEKSIKFSKLGIVTLEVEKNATKCDIKKACKIIFEADIEAVNTMITKPRLRGFKGKLARRQSKKKAIVKFVKNANIDKILGAV